jgi:hypothetical protein
VPRSRVRPAVRLSEVLPRDGGAARWQRVRDTPGLDRLPDFTRWITVSASKLTIRELCEWIIGNSAHCLKTAGEPWSREEIRAVIRAGVTLSSGLRDFSDDADLIRDLGIN